MKKSNKLPDRFYNDEVERLSGLPKFPALPAAQQEIRRALRRISETDSAFIRELITQAVDTDATCPTPAELIRRAGDIRHRARTSAPKTNCGLCHGTGFIAVVRKVQVGGMAPYETEFSTPCKCRSAA